MPSFDSISTGRQIFYFKIAFFIRYRIERMIKYTNKSSHPWMDITLHFYHDFGFIKLFRDLFTSAGHSFIESIIIFFLRHGMNIVKGTITIQYLYFLPNLNTKNVWFVNTAVLINGCYFFRSREFFVPKPFFHVYKNVL